MNRLLPQDNWREVIFRAVHRENPSPDVGEGCSREGAKVAKDQTRGTRRSAGLPTCRIADLRIGMGVGAPAGLETRDTADLEVCGTSVGEEPNHQRRRAVKREFMAVERWR